jgi:hypothetical protein
MPERITKKHVVEVSTQQSQNAQGVTAALRAHAWKTASDRVRDDDGRLRVVQRAATDDDRHRHLQRAVRNAEAVALNAEAVLSWVKAYARQEGVTT